MPPAIDMQAATVQYGTLAAVRDVSLRVERNEFLAIVGHNGAGKTTLVEAVAGLLVFQRGAITILGHELAPNRPRIPPGVAIVRQGYNVFADLSVDEHFLLLGREFSQRERSLFPELDGKRRVLAGSLSGGQRQMLAIAVALSGDPEILIVDEPSIGLAPILVQRVMATLKELQRSGDLTLLVVEQNLAAVVGLCDRLISLRSGEVDRILDRDQLRHTTPSQLMQLL